MRDNAQNVLRFLGLAIVVSVGWYYLAPRPAVVVPPAPKERLPNISREAAAAISSPVILAAKPFDALKSVVPPPMPVEVRLAPQPAAALPTEPPALIALGDDSFFIKALLTTRGGGVQQLILTKFKEASRLGEEVKDEAGADRPLFLIPGFLRPNFTHLADEVAYPNLQPNLSAADFATGKKPTPLAPELEAVLSAPSYAMYHYPSKDDPARPRDEKGQLRPEDDGIPLATLTQNPWKVVKILQSSDAPWEVVFETELGAPYHLRLRKTYTLARNEYDFKLKIDLEPMPGRVKDAGRFRYQIAGPVGMPVEGEWYTSTYRTAFIGWQDGSDTSRRAVDDASNIHYRHGGDKVVIAKPGRFTFAAVGIQYFASALAVNGSTADADQPWEYVRPSRVVPPKSSNPRVLPYDAEKQYLFDVNFRAVSRLFEVAPNETITHNYSVYNGPIKVRLLRQMTGDSEVPAETIDRYINEYHLDTLTDFHSPTIIGRFANSIYWADIVIASTNIMHSILGWLQNTIGISGLSIMMLTVIVRCCLFLPSRRQQTINAHMQAKITKLKPEIDKLNEKYAGDFMMVSQEKSKLFRKAGISQAAQMGGCLLIFAQMPIFMGLYFCLQESVFFRLESFLWINNLAAPDMLRWWSESVPFVSSPEARFGSFSFLYLGPYFNVLPMAAVLLFFLQQKLTMPPPTDEMQEQQQKMMKFMLIFSALFFYKVAAGLCLYFIVSGLWTLMERKLVPKPDLSKAEAIALGDDEADTKKSATLARTYGEPDAKPAGFFGRMKARLDEIQKQAEATRQIRNQPNGSTTNGNPAKPQVSPGERAQNRKNKKKKK